MSSIVMIVMIFRPLLVYSEFEHAKRESIRLFAAETVSIGFPSLAAIFANFSAMADSIIPGSAVWLSDNAISTSAIASSTLF